MSRPRFTIAGMLAAVTFMAAGLAALRAADDAWDGGLFGMTALTLLTAVLLAIHRRDVRRAYWLGFALFGWAYLILSLLPPTEGRLPTSKGLAYLDSQVPRRANSVTFTVSLNNQPLPAGSSVAFSPDGRTLANGSSKNSVRLWDLSTGKVLAGPNGTTERFVRIGHSLLALIFAVLGGGLSRRLYASDRRDHGGERHDPPSEDSTGLTR